MCIRAENVVLPKNGFFGVSAATGGLADDHDTLKESAVLNRVLYWLMLFFVGAKLLYKSI